MKKLYVGNLPYKMTDEELRSYFSSSGTVESAIIIFDRETGRSKGFGFVEMASPDEAQAAIEAFDGIEYEGRNLRVNIAKERERRPAY